MCGREGSENALRSSHPTTALVLHTFVVFSSPSWQESDFCFTERNCLLCSVPGFPAVIWHFEPVLQLKLSGILTQVKIEVCWSSVRGEREYKCFPAEVNIILNSYVLKHIYLKEKVHIIKKSLFPMLMINQLTQTQVRKSKLMLKDLSITF